jgi:hypothetical protein
MTAATVLLLVFVIAVVSLWVLGVVLDVNHANRFRIYATAVGLTYILLGIWLGWAWASALASIALWIAAVFFGAWRTDAVSCD